MNVLSAAGRFLLDLVIYVVNGLLVIVYFIADRWTLLISLLCGLVILLGFDVLVQRIAAAAPTRQGQRAPAQIARHHQVLTGATILAWLVAGSLFPTPVPQMGTIMWLLTVLALLVMPAVRHEVLWRGKTAILAYAVVLMMFKVVAAWALAADPREWATIVGTVEEAQAIIARGRGILLTIAAYLSWFGVPAGYAGYLVQRMTVHPMNLRDPLARAGEILYRIRQRPD